MIKTRFSRGVLSFTVVYTQEKYYESLVYGWSILRIYANGERISEYEWQNIILD